MTVLKHEKDNTRFIINLINQFEWFASNIYSCPAADSQIGRCIFHVTTY